MSQKVGILGGMGSAAGIYFAQQLVALNTAARRDADHAPFILYSDPHIPNRVDAYLKNTANPAPSVVASLNKLAMLGADFGVVICNTAHIYYDEIVTQVHMPVLNMVESAAERIGTHFPHAKVGLLATTATAKSGMYLRHCAGHGVALHVPAADDQNLIQAAIFDETYGIKATGNAPARQALEAIAGVAERMRRQHGVSHLLLGCTELSFAIPGERWMGFTVVDPVKILAQRCLARAGLAARETYSIAA